MSVLIGGGRGGTRKEVIASGAEQAILNTIYIFLRPPAVGKAFQITVGQTPVPLSWSPVQTVSVTLKADDDNTGNIYIGFDDKVSPTTGFRLKAGQGIDIAIDYLSKIWVVADADGQKLYVLYVSTGVEY